MYSVFFIICLQSIFFSRMCTVFLQKFNLIVIKRVSEAFSLVMKSTNCLRIRVLTRNACLPLAYVSPLGKHVLNQHMQQPHPLLGNAHKQSCAYHHVFKVIESLDGDCGMDSYALPFKGILIWLTPEIVLSSKRN